MARETGAACRKCRRERQKLYLKGTRCETSQCALERRDTPPGMHNFRRGKLTDHAEHLREKQKVKRYYGVLERQFRRYFAKASAAKGNTGDNLLALLERRLDNVVHRLGLGLSRAQARQMVSHGHILINDKRCDVASYLVRLGDVISVNSREKSIAKAKAILDESKSEAPDYLITLDGDKIGGQVVRMPEATDVLLPIQTQLIVEFCSR